MKKIIKYFISILLLFLILAIGMFLTNTCPPNGPWPTPPWCKTINRKIYQVSVSPTHINQTKAVNMFDTWGRNYNMGMFETTRDNIDSSFKRAKELGAEEIFVHDFHSAIFDKGSDYTTTNYTFQDETFWNDFRDESFSQSDINKLTASAHANNLKIGVKHNVHFVDMQKYIVAGISGNIQESSRIDYEKFNASHTEVWIRDYFSKWTNRLTERAKMYNEAGVDYLSIYPAFMDPTFAGNEKLANELQKQLISDLKKVFKGKIIAEVSRYGFFEDKNGTEDWTKYDFYKDADEVELRIYDLPPRYRSGNLEKDLTKYMTDLDKVAKNKGVNLSVFFCPSSYTNSLESGPLEVLDYNNTLVKSTQVDYQYQSDAYNTFFKVIKNTTNIKKLIVANYNWDDSIDPEVKPKISISTSFRNKPAEEVIKSWFTK